jgi:hypothetical protein
MVELHCLHCVVSCPAPDFHRPTRPSPQADARVRCLRGGPGHRLDPEQRPVAPGLR